MKARRRPLPLGQAIKVMVAGKEYEAMYLGKEGRRRRVFINQNITLPLSSIKAKRLVGNRWVPLSE